MRVLLRPFVLLVLLIAFTAAAQSQQSTVGVGSPGGGANIILFAAGMPQPISGGVNVGVSVQPTTGYTCTSVTISIVDQYSNTLASITVQNPGATVTQTFTNLGCNIPVQVVVNSVFQNGTQFDYPYLETDVTTNY